MAKLKKYLIEHNISQAELARRIGYTPASISQIINGTREGSATLWMAIAHVLNTNVEEIAGKEDEND